MSDNQGFIIPKMKRVVRNGKEYYYPASRYASSRYRKTKSQREKLPPLRGKKSTAKIYAELKAGKTIKRSAKKGKRTPVLVSKNGRLYKDRVDSLLADLKSKIKEKNGKTNAQALTEYNEARAIIESYKGGNEQLTIKTLSSKMKEDKYEKMFANFGYTVEEAAEEIGVPPEELVDPNNWENDKFTYEDVEFYVRKEYYRSIWYTK